MKKSMARFLVVLAMVLACPAFRLHAAGFDGLLPLLVDLPGWDAEPADGADASAEGMRAVTAFRSYESGERKFEVSVVIGSQAMGIWMPDYREGYRMETPEGLFEVKKVSGFLVYSMFDKQGQAGGIAVLLQDPGDRPEMGCVMAISFEGLPLEEALALAQRFSWPRMQEIAVRLK